MTSIKFTLSKKQRKETKDNEVLLRFSMNRKQVFRAKTNIYMYAKSIGTVQRKKLSCQESILLYKHS